MPASGFLDRRPLSPTAITLAIAVNAGVVAALWLSPPEMFPIVFEPIRMIRVPPDAPPPPPNRDVKPMRYAIARPVAPDHPLVDHPLDPAQFADSKPLTNPGNGIEDGGLVGGFVLPPIEHHPVQIGALPDPRFLRDRQPPYPPGMQRLEREGSATVRVLIGADGRVKRVERVTADDDAFYFVTARQALARWRFKPATRDGVPVETWLVQTVRFTLDD